MPTAKNRINMAVPNELFELIQLRAKRDEKSLASTAVELLDLAIEVEEDAYWNQFCDELDAIPNKKYLSHEEFWKKVGLE
jgi:hypothetical protein